MKSTTTTDLTLFSIRADYSGCEYGSRLIVAANDAAEAKSIALDLGDVTIKSCQSFGTSRRFAEPKIISYEIDLTPSPPHGRMHA